MFSCSGFDSFGYKGLEGILGYVPVLVRVMVNKAFENIPEELGMFSSSRFNSFGCECLELFLSAMIEDGVWIKLCHSFLDVFQAKLQPLIKGDDTGVLQVHGVKHLPQGLVILLHWAHGNEAGDKLQEMILAHEPILVSVSINKLLEKFHEEFPISITGLAGDGLLDEPEKVFLTLVEGLLTEDKFLNVGSFYFSGSGGCFSGSHLDNCLLIRRSTAW